MYAILTKTTFIQFPAGNVPDTALSFMGYVQFSEYICKYACAHDVEKLGAGKFFRHGLKN